MFELPIQSDDNIELDYQKTSVYSNNRCINKLITI